MIKVELVELDELRPNPNNPRLHSRAEVEQLAASLREFGWTVPILADGANNIVAGHRRRLAALSLRDGGKEIPRWPDTGKAPVIRLDALSREQLKAYGIADNQLTITGSWDESLLAAELQDLAGFDFDLSLIGFAPKGTYTAS